MPRRLALSLALLLLLDAVPLAGLPGHPVPAGAQALDGVATADGERAGPRTYGTADAIAHTISAWAFTGVSGADYPLQASVNGSRYCLGQCDYAAALSLPAGAVVSRYELDACDVNDAGQVRASLLRKPTFNGPVDEVAFRITGVPTMSGCIIFVQNLVPALVIDNENNSYYFQITLTGGTVTTRFAAVRAYYKLQVSPAPGTATFDDVPTDHPFFPFVEALVAAGITTGCSQAPPLFCPDGTVTRKQMAAFIARALGLHFAP